MAGPIPSPHSSISRAALVHRAALIVSVSICSALLAAFWMGTRFAARRFEREFERASHAATLRDVVEFAPGDWRGIVDAYTDPGRARDEMGSYTWMPPSVPTPFVGYAPRPGVSGNARINSLQLRHGGELADPKPAGLLRIFVTGGSAAFGSGAPAQELTIPAIMGDRIRALVGDPVEVVNAGVPAWASTQERIWIENRLSPLSPDLIVSLSGANEAHWGRQGRNVLWFRAYDDALFFDLLAHAYRSAGRPPPEDVARPERGPVVPELVARRLVANVRLDLQALSDQGAMLVFALQPVIQTTGKRLSRRELDHRERELLGPGTIGYFQACFAAMRQGLAQLEAPGYRFVDLSDVFDELGPDTEIFLDSYHFGDRGNALIAARLADAVAPLLPKRPRG